MFARPGLDHPPPGLGDGLRDRDMGAFGVPGIVSRVCALAAAWRFKPCGVFDAEAEDRRR